MMEVVADPQPSTCEAALQEAKRRAGLLHTDVDSRRSAVADLERRMVQHSEQLLHLKARFKNPNTLLPRRDGQRNATSHADPSATSTTMMTSKQRKVNDVTEGERIEITCQLVKGLRKEVAAWTRELLSQFPAGSFDDFFSSPLTDRIIDDAQVPLPPPPSQDEMFAAYHARQDCAATEAMAEATQSGVQRAVNSLQCEARHKLTSCVAEFVRGAAGPARSPIALDPVEVAGITPPAPVRVQRVEQTVRETHALILLSHVMHAAATIASDQLGSRGSSETPSVTTIGSVLDNHSGVGGPSASNLAAVGGLAVAATGDNSVAGAGRPSATSNAYASDVVGTSMRPGGMLSAASSVFSPVAHLNNKSASQRTAGNRSIRFQEATTMRVGGSGEGSHHEGGGSTAEGVAMVSSVGDSTSGSREQPSSSGTQHDTSTAATGGMSTAGSTDRAPQTKNVWSADDQREPSSSEHARASSRGSTSSSSRKKKRGLFSCIRRDDSGDES